MSTLDIEPNSQVFQEFFQSTAKYPQVNYIVIKCQVTIYHLYQKEVAQKVMLSDDLLMTPNLLELGGSRPAKSLAGNGASGPDNSPYRSSGAAARNWRCQYALQWILLLLLIMHGGTST